ncbi:MAG: hypothetical protein JWO47_145 [Candidatus Saccharibacteria bacterium]|nr:hypothetical protein [Candidatus Saccharibacteria bacterium]
MADKYQIDEVFLDEVGFKVTDAKKRLDKIEELTGELETRVGNAIARDLSESQLDEFEEVLEKDGGDAALEWLEDAYPDYKIVVDTQFKILRAELKSKGL